MASVGRGLDVVKRRAAAGTRLNRPASHLTTARGALNDAIDALEEVIEEPGFANGRANVLALCDEVSELVDRIAGLLGRDADGVLDTDEG